MLNNKIMLKNMIVFNNIIILNNMIVLNNIIMWNIRYAYDHNAKRKCRGLTSLKN